MKTQQLAPNQITVNQKNKTYFFSYNTLICIEIHKGLSKEYILDSFYWDYSRTTLKYLKRFMGIDLPKKEIENRIKQGMYKLEDLTKNNHQH